MISKKNCISLFVLIYYKPLSFNFDLYIQTYCIKLNEIYVAAIS